MSDLGNKEIFSRNLKKYMDLNSKDRNDMCKELKLPYTTFTDWYNGTVYPRIDKIEMLANYFNINKSDLIEDKKQLNSINACARIPVLGRISAGLPLFAEEQLEDYMFAPESIINEGNEYFYLRVEGDSMNTKFDNGDLVLIQKQSSLENGEIGVIRINGFDATVKRFKKQDEFIILEPMSTNPEHTVQIYNPKNIEITIIGKVIYYMGKV